MSRICNDEDDFRPSMDCAKRASFAQNDHRSVMKTFHLAEGPGGFIEAICNKRANLEDQYYGMTILIDDTDDNVPGWNKSSQFLSKHPNIQIERGADETGNLLHIENFDYCVHKYASSMDLITADGGFDFSKDFNKQEISIARLLWGQVCYALCLQKCGGNFVLKIFDIFYNHTIDILYILAGFYTEVNVCKLQTSRIGNSEKYVVCKGFRFENNSEFASIVRDSFSRIIEVQNLTEMNNWRVGDTRLSSSCKFRQDAEPHFAKDDATALFAAAHRTESSNTANYVWRILNFQVPRHFTKHVEDINAMFGHQQIENIHYTISLIDKHSKYDKTEQLTKQNITKCVNWCLEHKIPYYSVNSLNVFSGMESAATGI